MSELRDRESVLRGLHRELAYAAGDDERTKAIRAEIKRIEDEPIPEAPGNDEPTPAENAAARAQAYLAGLRRELTRGPSENRAAVEAEIKRIEAELSGGAAEQKTERAVQKQKAERATANPA